MAIREFRLPDPGEGLVEAEIVTWRVAVGDTIKINDIVVEVETSKSLVELPTPYAGTVSGLLVAEGDLVDVGRPIIAIDDGVAAEPADEAIEPGKIGGEAPGGRVAILVGYGPKTAESKRRPRKGAVRDTGPAEVHEELAAATFAKEQPVSRRADDREALHPGDDGVVADAAPLPSPGHAVASTVRAGGAILAKPPVRKRARDLGVDLGSVDGSGPGGVITRDDVEAAASAGSDSSDVPDVSAVSMAEPAVAVAPAAARPAAVGDTRVPIKGVRKATAAAMVRSAFTAPHVTEWVTCDVSATVELVARLKERREFRGVRISPLLIVAKAVCLALGRTPELNSFWDDPVQEIVLKKSVNLGIAAATPRGLVVPNIKGAESMTLLELAGAINGIVSTAREGKTQPAAMSNGTFTITNVGTFGVDAGTPILNPGESGILCFGQIARRPWVVGTGSEERIEPRWVSTLAVSFDHRLADGEQGSVFLSAVAQILTNPGLALLY